MSCKVRIDAPHGIVEIEGDPEFVTAFYEKLAPLVDKAHFGIAVSNEQSHALSGDEGHGDADDSSTTKTAKRKKKRANPPPGC